MRSLHHETRQKDGSTLIFKIDFIYHFVIQQFTIYSRQDYKTFQWILALKVEEQEEQTWLDR